MNKKDELVAKVLVHPELKNRVSEIGRFLTKNPENVEYLYLVKDDPAALKANIENDLKGGSSDQTVINEVRALRKDLVPVVQQVAEGIRRDLDPWGSPSNRTTSEQTDWKEKLKQYYERHAKKQPAMIKCMITNEALPSSEVKASHIWKRSTNGRGLKSFKLSASDVSTTRNGLLLSKAIEEAFDVKEVCFIRNALVDPAKLLLLVLNRDGLYTKTVAPSSKKKLHLQILMEIHFNILPTNLLILGFLTGMQN